MNKNLIKVAKFGGSSLASASQFKKVKKIIEEDAKRTIVVCSAVGRENSKDSKVTDLLYLLHAHIIYSVPYNQIFDTIKQRYIKIKKALNINFDIEKEFDDIESQLNKNIDIDYLVSRGEYLSAKLLSSYLGYTFIDAKELIQFDYKGNIDNKVTKQKIREMFETNKKIVVPGFYGAFPNGKIHLMSRGGSDITGSILARALHIEMYENWTDVSGILMVDPRIISNPKRINEITYDELREMSYMGAKVLHEETVFPVQELSIPINILNTNDSKNPGTIIRKKCTDVSQVITGITGTKDYISFNITRKPFVNKTLLTSSILEIFNNYDVTVEHIPSSIDSFSVVVSRSSTQSVLYDILGDIKANKYVKSVEVDEDIALVAVVGRNMVTRIGISGRIFGLIGNSKINIKMISQGAVEYSIVVGVSNKDFKKTIKVLYDNLVK